MASMRNGYKGRPGQVSLLRKLGPREVRKPLLSEMGPELLAVRAIRTQCSLFVFCEDILYRTGKASNFRFDFHMFGFQKTCTFASAPLKHSFYTQFRLP